MVTFSESELTSEILERVIRIENAVRDGLREGQQKLDIGQDSFRFSEDGLKAYKGRYLEETQSSRSPLAQWQGRIQADKELRFPHRKILEFLLNQYNFENRCFEEVHFTRLVREARVGTNMAQTYFSFLNDKGYIEKRDDGYRLFFRIRG